MIQIEKINQSKISHKEEVLRLTEEAKKYLNSLEWCDQIMDGWLAKDFGYVLCVFLFEIKPTENSRADRKVWIVVGDIPPAYIDILSAHTVREVLDAYCYIMEDWIIHVKNGESVENCFPIDVPATEKYADMLQTRVDLIRSDYMKLV